MSELVVGLDVGGTQIRAILADRQGTVLERHTQLTLAHEGLLPTLARIKATVAAAMAGQTPLAIGAGVPGPTDPYAGMLLMGPNLPGWRNVNLRQILQDEFGIPVYVGNDANVAALAEHRYGAGVGVRHMVYLTVSTGIGSGVIIDDRMLLGHQGLAAEVGHMTIDVHSEQGGDNLVGTLEGLASGPNFARRAQYALRHGAQSAVIELAGGNIEDVNPRILNQAARQGDAFAQGVYHDVGTYLGVGICNMLHIFNPERIVIGGSVWLHARDLLAEPMWAAIRGRAQSPEYWQNLSIVTAALGDDVGLLGAVALAYDGLQGKREV